MQTRRRLTRPGPAPIASATGDPLQTRTLPWPDGTMDHPVEVYVFRSGGFARNGDSVVCAARCEHIEGLLGAGILDAVFFGHAEYRDDEATRYLAVWGARNASRLRRLLRERGAELAVHHAPPPARLHHWTTRPRARTAARAAAKRVRESADRAPDPAVGRPVTVSPESGALRVRVVPAGSLPRSSPPPEGSS